MTGRSQRHMINRDGYSANGTVHQEGGIPPGEQIPTTTSISPTGAVHGDSNATLTVNGTNFTANTRVVFNGAQLTTTFVNSTQVTCTAPIAAQAAAGAVQVGVRNGERYSNTQTFTFT